MGSESWQEKLQAITEIKTNKELIIALTCLKGFFWLMW